MTNAISVTKFSGRWLSHIAVSILICSHLPQKEKKVPLRQVRCCHLLDYESQILSIVLSHCHYSLTAGKGQKISYDLPALEKHILDRFIHGKPLILSDIPQVVYRSDVCTAETFARIRNMIPQKVSRA